MAPAQYELPISCFWTKIPGMCGQRKKAVSIPLTKITTNTAIGPQELGIQYFNAGI